MFKSLTTELRPKNDQSDSPVLGSTALLADSADTTTCEPTPGNQVTQVPKPPPIKYGMIPIDLPVVEENKPYVMEFEGQDGSKNYDIYMLCDIGYCDGFATDIINILNHAKSDSTVRFFINSPGGSLEAGAQVCAAMSRTEAETVTIACGMVASAAALIWSYGKKKLVEPGSYIMFHMSSHGDCGNSEDIRSSAENLVEYVKYIALDPVLAMGLLTDPEASDLIEKRMDIYLDSAEITKRLKQNISTQSGEGDTHEEA